MPAGDIILAGDIARVIYSYEYAGRGTRGWEFAEQKLRERHPTATANSIRAVMDRAREAVQVGHNYRQGNPGYVPRNELIPDVRPLELAAAQPPPAPPSGYRPSYWYHEGIIEIRDPNRAGAIVGRVTVTVPQDSILTREQFEQAIRDRATPFFDTFVRYERLQKMIAELEYTVRIAGVYHGY